MAGTRKTELRDRAYDYYLSGIGRKEIVRMLGLSKGALDNWVTAGKWVSKKKNLDKANTETVVEKLAKKIDAEAGIALDISTAAKEFYREKRICELNDEISPYDAMQDELTKQQKKIIESSIKGMVAEIEDDDPKIASQARKQVFELLGINKKQTEMGHPTLILIDSIIEDEFKFSEEITINPNDILDEDVAKVGDFKFD